MVSLAPPGVQAAASKRRRLAIDQRNAGTSFGPADRPHGGARTGTAVTTTAAERLRNTLTNTPAASRPGHARALRESGVAGEYPRV